MKSRLRFVAIGMAILFSAISVRILWVAHMPFSQKEYHVVDGYRGSILDRNGVVLASSLQTYTIYAHPSKIEDITQTARDLARIFPQHNVSYFNTLLRSQKSFVWIARNATYAQKMAIKALGIEGLDIQSCYQRLYPHGRCFAHMIGMVNTEQKGIAGMEKYYDHMLSIKKDSLRTSFDVRLQHILYERLQNYIRNFEARAGNAILANVHTGEILAMVSLPDFDPTEPVTKFHEGMFNRNVSGVYEFGSIMKTHNLCLFLDQKKGTLQTVFDATHPLRIGRFRITDFNGKKRPMTVEEGFLYSSNIVNAKMALSVGGDMQRAFFKKIGFMDTIMLEIPEYAKPCVPKRWTQDRVITASYGYGLSVTPLHLVASMITMVSGYAIPLTLRFVENSQNINKKPVIEQHLVETICRMLGNAVKEGQCKKAYTSACPVGGKTGTANLRSGKRYCEKQNLVSCVAIFPVYNPQYILFVSLEKPKASAKTQFYATAGWIAAPLVSEIITESAPLLNMLKKPS